MVNKKLDVWIFPDVDSRQNFLHLKDDAVCVDQKGANILHVVFLKQKHPAQKQNGMESVAVASINKSICND